MSTLPKVPSALIRLAIADLEKCEATPGYIVDMAFWHYPAKQCWVCLAGAVMAMSLGADASADMEPSDYVDERNKLLAINNFRRGYIEEGLAQLGLDRPEGVPAYLSVPYYSDDKVG